MSRSWAPAASYDRCSVVLHSTVGVHLYCRCQQPALLPDWLHGLQLFLGDTNRTISETPMNMASSRSHCVFTVYVEARKVCTAAWNPLL